MNSIILVLAVLAVCVTASPLAQDKLNIGLGGGGLQINLGFNPLRPLSVLNLPRPTYVPGLGGVLNFLNATMNDIINSPPVESSTCMAHHEPPPGYRNAIPNNNGLWKNSQGQPGYINFQIDPQFTAAENQVIQNGIFQLYTVLNGCLRFGLWPSNATPTGDYVYITSSKGSGCLSGIGRQGGKQNLFLERPYDPNQVSPCVYEGTTMHEVMHALGFFHEQTRRDRDSFVDVYLNNVIENQRYNFDIAQDALPFVTPYDYYSIMHYDGNAFSSNGQKTMSAKTPGVVVGMRNALTDSDKVKLKSLYKC